MGHKGRPKKVRYIQKMPKVVQFSPRGRPGRPDEVELTLDQYEAIKLADYQGFDQAQGATVMRLSRASFGRILRVARAKISDALVNGKIIKFRMGDIQIGVMKSEFTKDSIVKEIEDFKIRTQRLKKDAGDNAERSATEGTKVLDGSVKLPVEARTGN